MILMVLALRVFTGTETPTEVTTECCVREKIHKKNAPCVLAFPNFIMTRTDAWRGVKDFSRHVYTEGMSTTTTFTGPFLSKVQMKQSATSALSDSRSKGLHVDCSHANFTNKDLNKCRMMSSEPMFLGTVVHSYIHFSRPKEYYLSETSMKKLGFQE